MYITRIESLKNGRFKVQGEDGLVFPLYAKELKQYRIAENAELSEDVLAEILESVVYKRGKERALYLLERRPLSSFMLRTKLSESGYPESVITSVISFLEEYHYLDDYEYVRMYVNSYSGKKSKRQLVSELMKKGISRDMLETYFSEYDYSEKPCFERQFSRYTSGKDLKDPIVRQKVFKHFYGKGFQPSLIEAALKGEYD